MLHFTAYVMRGCQYCDELGKIWNFDLAKKYQNMSFRVVCLDETFAHSKQINLFPTVRCIDTMNGSIMGEIKGVIYDKTLTDFIEKMKHKYYYNDREED